MFRISPDKVSRDAKKVPNTVSASSRTKLITVSQPSVTTKKDINSNLNGLSSTGLDNTKTRRPQPRSNTKNDRVPSASKSSQSKNKDVKVEEHHRNLLLSKKNKHISLACNNSKIDSQDVISKVVCVVCKKCLNSVNHDVCLNNCVNGKKSRGRKHKANVSKNETQKKYRPKVSKSKNVGIRKSLATPKPRKPRFLLRGHRLAKCLTKMANLLLPVTPRVMLTALMVIMLVPLTLWNLKSNGFQILLLYLAGYPDLFMVRRFRLFQSYDRKSKASYQFRLKVYGNCPLRE
nr:hypothetical protein [Tanacetum cinerariifolium]